MGETKIATPQAVAVCHDLLAWIIPQLDKFPRARRFTLGERIESGLLYVLEWLIEVTYAACRIELADVRTSVVAWLGHVRHAESGGLCRAVLGSVCYVRGTDQTMRPACAAGRRLEQQTEEPPLRQPQQGQRG